MSGVGQIQMWIGIHDANEDDNLVTVDGTSLDWTKWGPNQPSHLNGNDDPEDGVEIRNQSPFFNTWNDHAKSHPKVFACTYVKYN